MFRVKMVLPLLRLADSEDTPHATNAARTKPLETVGELKYM